jgi:hypothetical protein
MTVLAHPTLVCKPVLADAIAARVGGEWEVCGSYCRLRPRLSLTVPAGAGIVSLIPAFLRRGANPLPDFDGPEVA